MGPARCSGSRVPAAVAATILTMETKLRSIVRTDASRRAHVRAMCLTGYLRSAIRSPIPGTFRGATVVARRLFVGPLRWTTHAARWQSTRFVWRG